MVRRSPSLKYRRNLQRPEQTAGGRIEEHLAGVTLHKGSTMRLIRLLASLDAVADSVSHLPDTVRLHVEKAYDALSKAVDISAALGMRVETRELPDSIQKALKSVGYGRRDIAVSTGTSFVLQNGGASGKKSFSTIVNLDTGMFKTEMGSWGGANMFNQTLTDDDNTRRPLPPGIAVIQGSLGGGEPTYATIMVHPSTLAPLLPAPAGTDGPTEDEVKALDIIGGLISSARKTAFDREGLGAYGASNPIVDSLAKKGLVKTTANGAVAITTAGKNARSGRSY